jgi:thiosulfate dehydrogenase
MRSFTRIAVAVALTAGIGCSIQDVSRRNDSLAASGTGAAPTTIARAAGWRLDAWSPPAIDSIPDGPEARSIRRGLALFSKTRDSLRGYASSNLNCSSCHLDNGRRASAVPLYGVHGMYPRYNGRADAVVSIADRINFCMTRSLAGNRLPENSREMQDMVAYLAFLSRGVPGGIEPLTVQLPRMAPMQGDSARGKIVFVEDCARCHGGDGAGTVVAPALWGAKSFSIGASMAREERAASFIRHNMPLDRPGTMTDERAYDVAAYITSLPRPDLPLKERDWPKGDAPRDVPYRTRDHTPTRTPRLLPRPNAAAAIVTAPRSVKGRD